MNQKNNIETAEKQSLAMERSILVAAKIKAQNFVTKDPSASNLAALDKATKMLLEYDQRNKPEDNGGKDQPEPVFQNRIEALRWLKDQGFKIEKSKLYKDFNTGVIPYAHKQPIRLVDIKVYSQTLAIVENNSGTTGELHEKKLRKEIERLEGQVAKSIFDLSREKGKYLLKTDVITETAIKIAALDAGLRHLVATSAIDWIYAVGGDSEKLRILINLFNAGLDELLDGFATMEEIKVVIKKNQNYKENDARHPATS